MRPRRFWLRGLLWSLSWLVLAACRPALALLSEPLVSPPRSAVALNRAARLTVRWQMVTDAGPEVRSMAGELRDAAGNLLYRVERVLSRPAPDAGIPLPDGSSSRQTVRLNESLGIPAGVLARALNQGSTRLFYVRAFADANSTLSSQLVLDITGAGGAGFSIGYLGLRFDDDSVRRLVQPDSPLRARARVRFAGSGQLQGVWEIADPASASGTPVYRPLRLVRKPLFGGEAVEFDSPPLPTARAGPYRLRLRVTAPALDDVPVLQYYVSPATGRGAQPVELLGPAPGARLGPETRFGWRPVPGARAYRLEIHAPAGSTGPAEAEQARAPLAGVLLGADEQQARLGALAWDHVRAGGRYRWRVVAIDAQGERLGVSEWRPLGTRE